MSRRGSIDWKNKISLGNKGNKSRSGQPHTYETKIKISSANKGKTAWNKGLSKSDPRVMQYAEKLKKRVFTDEWKRKISEAKKGKPSNNLGKKLKTPVWNKGKRLGDNPLISDEKHYLWKGDDVGYKAIHGWIKRKYGSPKICEECGSIKNLEWANESGKYKRDRNDWIQLCKSCHNKKDNIIRNLGDYSKTQKATS